MIVRLLSINGGFDKIEISRFFRKTWVAISQNTFFICIFWNWSPSIVQLFAPLGILRKIANYDFVKQCSF